VLSLLFVTFVCACAIDAVSAGAGVTARFEASGYAAAAAAAAATTAAATAVVAACRGEASGSPSAACRGSMRTQM
jgi:hypothetical protein